MEPSRGLDAACRAGQKMGNQWSENLRDLPRQGGREPSAVGKASATLWVWHIQSQGSPVTSQMPEHLANPGPGGLSLPQTQDFGFHCL